MKTKKIITLVLCAVLLVAMSAAGTLAYLTDSDAVTNTFSVGKVGITLDESDVDEYGKKIPSASPVVGNDYLLVPGYSYTKDPTIHVVADSESSWLFVKVDNGISDVETKDAAKTIHGQMISTTYGWTPLEGVANVYYKEWAKGSALDVPVFGSFTIDGSADNAAIAAQDDDEIVVTAYAVQMAGFEDDAAGAWAATFGAPTVTPAPGA